MSNEIIKDQAKLKTYAQEALTAYASAGRRIHIAVVSAFYHAAKHGDPSMLNFVYNGLRPNDQTAVKMFVRRAAATVGLKGENPDKRDVEVIKAAVAQGGILDMRNGSFMVTRGHNTDEAKLTAEYCESRWINPDGKNDKFILDRNNITESSILGDSDFLNRIITLNKALTSTSENRTVKVSDKVAKLIGEFADKATVMLNQASLAEEPKAPAKATNRTPRARKAPVQAPATGGIQPANA